MTLMNYATKIFCLHEIKKSLMLKTPLNVNKYVIIKRGSGNEVQADI